MPGRSDEHCGEHRHVSVARESAMSHRHCDSKEDTGAVSNSRVGIPRLLLKSASRAAHGKLVQPVPYTGGAPVDFLIHSF